MSRLHFAMLEPICIVIRYSLCVNTKREQKGFPCRTYSVLASVTSEGQVSCAGSSCIGSCSLVTDNFFCRALPLVPTTMEEQEAKWADLTNVNR